jgi:hypothetical protein
MNFCWFVVYEFEKGGAECARIDISNGFLALDRFIARLGLVQKARRVTPPGLCV